MSNKLTIQRIFFIAATVVVLVSLTTLLLAANNKTDSQLCAAVEVIIEPDSKFHYINKEEVLLTVEKTAGTTLVGRAVNTIDLRAMEDALEQNDWVKDAQLYFDSRKQLNIVVTERRPVARFITTAGSSFYIDKEGALLSYISDKPIRLQVITGFTAAKKWNQRDSSLFEQARNIIGFISADPFWNAQVGQIDITRDGTFELIPVVGNGVIRIGSGDDVEEKFRRLSLFYSQVLTKTGFNKYAAIDVQYQGQVVGVKKEKSTAVDSVQLKKNIEEFLKRKQLQQLAEAGEESRNLAASATPENEIQLINRSPETESKQVKETVRIPVNKHSIDEKPNSLSSSVSVKTKPNPIPVQKPSGSERKTDTKPATEKTETEPRRPKAVMPKREQGSREG